MTEAYEGVTKYSREVPAPPRSPAGIIRTPEGENTFPSPRLQPLPSRGETDGHRLSDVCLDQEGRAEAIIQLGRHCPRRPTFFLQTHARCLAH